MADIIDLSLVADARNTLQHLLDTAQLSTACQEAQEQLPVFGKIALAKPARPLEGVTAQHHAGIAERAFDQAISEQPLERSQRVEPALKHSPCQLICANELHAHLS